MTFYAKISADCVGFDPEISGKIRGGKILLDGCIRLDFHGEPHKVWLLADIRC